MPTTTRTVFGGATGNSFSSTTTQVSGSAIRYVDDQLENLDPDEVPLQKLIGTGEAVTNRKIEWYDDRLAPTSDTLNGGINAAVTAVVVTNVARFQQYDLIKIEDEVLLVTAITDGTSTLTVAARGTYSTAATHASGVTVEILMPALPENTDTPPSPVTRGDPYFNYCQIADYGFQVSYRENEALYYHMRGKEYNKEVAKKYREAMIDFERLLFHGVAVDASGALPSTMGGFPAYITTNASAMAGAAFSRSDVLNLLQLAFAQVGKANMGKLLVMNSFAKEVLGSFWDAYRTGGMDTRVAANVIDKIATDFGTIDTMMHYWCPVASMFLIDPKNYSLRPFRGGQWQDEPLAKSGPYFKGHLYGDYGGEFKGNRAHAKMTGYSTTRGDYPTLAP
jgi:hypothetical protein